MIELPGFVITGRPTTKKTSGRIITITPKGQKRSTCRACNRVFGRTIMLPSEAYEEWEGNALSQMPGIKLQLARAGVTLPLVGLVSIEAHIYREANVGDVAGFHQAIGDMLQKAGIIKNDVQIEDWDGTRRLKDAARPRVEIFITTIDATQETLPLAQGSKVE